MFLKKLLSSMTLIHPKPTRNIYNKLKTTSLIKLLFLIILFMGSATSKEAMRDELTLLNPGMNAKYYVKIPAEPQEPQTEGKRTTRFRTNVEILEKKFQNIYTLTKQQQDALLDKYQNKVIRMGRNMSLTRQGFGDDGFDISDETAQKLKSILALYKHRQSSSCSIQ